MPADITIRPGTPGDAEAISALIGALASYFLADPDSPEEAATFLEEVTPEAIRGHLASERYQYHVAMDSDGLTGAIGMRDSTHLYQLVVARRAWRRGLARRLWTTARQTAEAAGNSGRFTVNSSRYAVPVYKRFGFEVSGPERQKDGIAFIPMKLEPSPSTDDE